MRKSNPVHGVFLHMETIQGAALTEKMEQFYGNAVKKQLDSNTSLSTEEKIMILETAVEDWLTALKKGKNSE